MRGRSGVILLGLVAVAASSTSAQVPGLGSYHALVIGNQAYRSLRPLQTPVADATAVADMLRRDYGFARVRLLTNATRADMVRALDDLRRRLGPGDNLLIYYAGHGWLDREADRGYWLPVDAEPDSRTNWLSNADLTDTLRALKAKHVVIVADSCYSGTLTRSIGVTPLAPPDILRLAQKRARTALVSGGLEPVADVGGGRHSVFARAFLDALHGNQGATDLTSLFGVIRRQVLLGATQTPEYADIRQAGHDGGDFVFVRPGARLAAPPSPAPPQPRESPVPAPQVAAIPPGAVRIESSPPGAEVYWDARPVGKTPLTLPSADPGRHQLVLVLPGYATLLEDVEVTAGQSLRVARKLEEQAGALEITTKPSGARIELDGVPFGLTPQKLPRVRVGKHAVKLTHPDHQAVEREVAIEFEQVAKLEVDLPPKPGRLVITSTPATAEVWVGSRKLGATVWVGELPPGKHLIRVAKEGFEDRLFDVLLGPNEAKSLDARLKKWDLGEMVFVPAGEFWMGSDDGESDEGPRHRAYVDALHIDKFEITNVQFKAFVDARGYERRELWSRSGWQWRSEQHLTQPLYWNDSRWNAPKQPVVGVSWYEAEAFCKFGGKRLPTEAEWEKAARGAEGRKYPWGDQWESSGANSDESKLGTTAPVGSYPTGVSPYGAHDMAGNVWEWVADWYSDNYYHRSPGRSPRGPDSAVSKVIRGGSWDDLRPNLRSANRSHYPPGNRGNDIGFRCAKGSQ